MNKTEIKKLINEEFGFAINKIVLLETSCDERYKYDYVMFSVCNIEYQMNYSYIKQRYILHVYYDNGAIDNLNR